MTNLTNDEISKIVNDNKPNKFISFCFKNFGAEWTKVKYITIGIIILFFLLCYVLGIIGIKKLALDFAIIFSCSLAVLVFLLFIARIWNNIRLNKIAKLLGVPADQVEYYLMEYEK